MIANWAGFYVGLNGGAFFIDGDQVDHIRTAHGDGGDGGEDGANGAGGGGGGGGGGGAALAVDDDALVMGGIHAGYNWQRQNWVYGIEGDIGAVEDAYDYMVSVQARLGWATDNVLLYATSGVAFARNDSFNGNVSIGAGGTGGDGDDGADGRGGDGGAGGAFVGNKGDNDEVGFVIGSGMDVKLLRAVQPRHGRPVLCLRR